MRRIADVGAAVIGTGFIGTVHVEALRRIGVQVRGVLGSTPERGEARARGARRAARVPVAREPPRRPVRRRRPRHLAEPPPRPADAGDPGRRPARRLREAAGDDRGRVGGAGPPGRRRAGSVNAVNFNIRFYPLHQHVRELVADGAARRRPLRHRPLLPGLAAPRDRLELAARAGQGRRRSGRSATSARTGSTSRRS